MTTLSFTIPGRIGGKGRPRSVLIHGNVRNLTPKATRSQELIVRQAACDAMGSRELIQGPVKLKILVEQHHPKSWSKKRKATSRWITGRPDCDNQIKLIADSLNGIVFDDDAQIAEIEYGRYFVTDQSRECVSVWVSELEWIQVRPLLREQAA